MGTYRTASEWDELVPQIVSDLNHGKRLTTIAKSLDLSTERLRQVLKKYGQDIPAQRPLPLGKRPSKAVLIQREHDIVKARTQEGLSLEEIGTKYEITRERVRQILVEAGYDTHTEQARAGREERDASERQNLHDMLVTLLTDDPSLSRAALAEETVTSVDEVSRLLGSSIWMLSEEQIVTVSYDDDDMLRALRRAARETGANGVSGRAYDAWRKSTGEEFDLPGSQTIIRRFGTWSKAVTEAGLQANATRRTNYSRMPKTDAVVAVAIFIMTERKANPYARATSADYEAYAALNPQVPSIAGLRLYWPWREVRIAAVRHILDVEARKRRERDSEASNA